jgi:subtilisin family serine protease
MSDFYCHGLSIAVGARIRWLIACGVFLLLFLLSLHTGRVLQAQEIESRAGRLGKNGRVDAPAGPKYTEGKVIVRFRKGTSESAMAEAHASVQSQVLHRSSLVENLEVVELPANTRVKDAIHAYKLNPNVLYAEPVYVVHAVDTPNDPDFSQQWALANTGQNGGVPGADIHATQAWGITKGSSNIVVAVVDTGIDYTHQDLSANAWSAPSSFSVPFGNGVVTCPAGSHGFNALSGACDPFDDNGHGTHVSGTIGAVGNNGIGVAGINWSVNILACKFLDSTGSGDTDGAIACMQLLKSLKDSGIKIIVSNNSCDVTGVFCTSESEREFTLGGSWYADAKIQAGANRDLAAAGGSGNRERKDDTASLQRS